MTHFLTQKSKTLFLAKLANPVPFLYKLERLWVHLQKMIVETSTASSHGDRTEEWQDNFSHQIQHFNPVKSILSKFYSGCEPYRPYVEVHIRVTNMNNINKPACCFSFVLITSYYKLKTKFTWVWSEKCRGCGWFPTLDIQKDLKVQPCCREVSVHPGVLVLFQSLLIGNGIIMTLYAGIYPIFNRR